MLNPKKQRNAIICTVEDSSEGRVPTLEMPDKNHQIVPMGPNIRARTWLPANRRYQSDTIARRLGKYSLDTECSFEKRSVERYSGMAEPLSCAPRGYARVLQIGVRFRCRADGIAGVEPRYP